MYFAFDRFFLSRHVIFYKVIDKRGNFAGVLLSVKREFAPQRLFRNVLMKDKPLLSLGKIANAGNSAQDYAVVVVEFCTAALSVPSVNRETA